MPEPLTVVIPLGPEEHHIRWLDECLESVCKQTLPPDEILIIDDGGNRDEIPGTTMWHAPWTLGISGSLNCGVGLAKNECVFILASDDWLETTCLEVCVAAYEEAGRPNNHWFTVGCYIHHSSDGHIDSMMLSSVPGLFTKTFWKTCGGFPSVPVPDVGVHQVISIFGLGEVELVGKTPLYNFRFHDATATQKMRDLEQNLNMTLHGQEAGLAVFSRELAVRLWKQRS